VEVLQRELEFMLKLLLGIRAKLFEFVFDYFFCLLLVHDDRLDIAIGVDVEARAWLIVGVG
jgi:hypothetical protein